MYGLTLRSVNLAMTDATIILIALLFAAAFNFDYQTASSQDWNPHELSAPGVVLVKRSGK
jgi:hypothetical protein